MRKLSVLAVALISAGAARAQASDGWQACAGVADAGARLACFDRWAAGQSGQAPSIAAPSTPPASAAAETQPAIPPASPPGPTTTAPAVAAAPERTKDLGCQDPQHSELMRFWELTPASGCGIFGIRSYRPISLSVVASDSVNRQPTSENPLNNAAAPQPYRTTEMRIQLSVRTKLAEGILTEGATRRDSLWFGYTQQSYWQLFTGAVSRPFRNTDHEPEVMYVYPLMMESLGGWNLRYVGLGLVHQSNGQSLPLSRSWNRAYLMAGLEHRDGFTLEGRVWRRLPEDSVDDDNPGISDYVGRAELAAGWRAANGHQLRLTVRNSLRREARGSARLQWLVPMGTDDPVARPGSLRLHTQLFTGYGDSLIDYNRKRTVLSIGLSLVDW